MADLVTLADLELHMKRPFYPSTVDAYTKGVSKSVRFSKVHMQWEVDLDRACEN